MNLFRLHGKREWTAMEEFSILIIRHGQLAGTGQVAMQLHLAAADVINIDNNWIGDINRFDAQLHRNEMIQTI